MPTSSASPPANEAAKFATVDAYIESFPEAVQAVLQQVRRALHDVVANAGETISYGIPTLTVDGRAVVYFAGWKRHVSLYPLPDGDAAFDALVTPYRSGASTARFPLTQPVPLDVVRRAGALLAERLDTPGS